MEDEEDDEAVEQNPGMIPQPGEQLMHQQIDPNMPVIGGGVVGGAYNAPL